MSTKVATAEPHEPLQLVARRMRAHDIAFLPVCRRERVVGVVTARDLALRAVAEGADPTRVAVAEVMTEEISYCFEDEAPGEAWSLMRERGVRRLVVLDRKMHLVGVLSAEDLEAAPEDLPGEEASAPLGWH